MNRVAGLRFQREIVYLKKHWHRIVIFGLWGGLMFQFWDMWRRNLLADKPYVLIPELVFVTAIAISGCWIKNNGKH